MEDYQTRQEQKEAASKKVELFQTKMKTAVSILSKTPEGCLLLRFLMHECCFTSPLMYETPEGVNTDVMIGNETKRRLYLSLRSYMDRETIMRVELPETKGETNA
jgi:hypothetical protein